MKFPPAIRIAAGVVATVAVLSLTACLEPDIEETTPENAQEVVNGLTYAKAKNGVCFAVGTTSRVSTGGNVAFSNLLTTVPCDAVGLGEPK